MAFGERNKYGINPTFTTIDVAGSDINCNFNDGLQIPVPDASVNILFTSHALEHLTDSNVRTFLVEALRVLSKNGRLMIEVPDCEYLYKAWLAGEREMFDAFAFDDMACRAIGHPELAGRRDVAFCGVISCGLMRMDDGTEFHCPVAFREPEFDRNLRELSMDQFFHWLHCLQDDEQKAMGGHVSAWYPRKLETLLYEVGFSRVINIGQKMTYAPSFLFRRGFRSTYSFRMMATKLV